jgi:hypothetical protein
MVACRAGALFRAPEADAGIKDEKLTIGKISGASPEPNPETQIFHER